ncbi:hypothetical protein QP369_25520, partial [Escherichia coli]|nr:hypothetical protein [Escherichia coli]
MTSTSSAETNSTTPPSSLGSTEAALRQLDGKISLWTGIPFGIQHVLAMFVANLAPIAIVVAAA